MFSLNVTDSKEKIIGTFNIGAKFKYVGEDADTDQLSLTNDEVSLLERAFKSLSSGQDTISATLLDSTIEDLDLSDGNMIYHILKQIDFKNANEEINFDQFLVLVGKALKDYESDLDVKAAHSFLSSDGNSVTVEDLVK